MMRVCRNAQGETPGSDAVFGRTARDKGVAWMAVALASLALAGCLGEDDDAGPVAAPQPRLDAGMTDAGFSTTGRWLGAFDAEIPAINLVLLHDGRLLYWSGVEQRDTDGATEQTFLFGTEPYWAESRIIDLSTRPPTITTPGNFTMNGEEVTMIDLFCSSATILPDGRVVTVGGSDWTNLATDADFALQGIKQTAVFDPATDNWTLGGDMALGRWYPTIFTDAEGSAVVATGIESLTDPNEQWAAWERYDAAAGAWEGIPGMDALLPLYAHLWVVPGGPLAGDVFFNTAATLWGPFGEHPQEYEWMNQKSFDMEEGTWRDLGRSVFGVRNYAVSVMLPLSSERDYAPEFVTFGGSLWRVPVATPFSERADLSTDPPTNAAAAPMNNPRWNHQGVLLPDGTILAIGGGLYDNVYVHGQPNIAVNVAEVYDPAADTWTEVAEMAIDRMYHSTALLLPDGRVLVAGHVPLPDLDEDEAFPQIVEKRMEIYEPGYLFRGARPAILDAPAHVDFGASFDLEILLPEGAALDSVLLVRPGAITHTWDTNQRAVLLDVQAQNGTTVTVAAPPSGVVAPPGHYMVFALSEHADGPVPSQAAWIHIT